MTIYVVDDVRIFRVGLVDELRDEGYTVYEFANAESALAQIKQVKPDVILSDIKMPGMGGMALMNKVRNLYNDIIFVIITAYATIDTAIEAIKLGAYDYLIKPFEIDKLLITLSHIKECKSLKEENKELKKEISKIFDFSSFIGNSQEKEYLFNLVKKVVNTNSTVLITGETGTGKELLTNIIHYNSNRNNKAFIKVSCAILSREIFESELFGHVKGAFTGAAEEKIGRFELANKGTLYLDDIDDMPYNLQVKLLRVLEEGEIEKVGGTETIKIDVRVIASTKVDLAKLVSQGKFRQDLYFRLNIFPLNLPPLRERKTDIKFTYDFFVNKLRPEKNIITKKEVYNVLNNYPFLGNVRELKNLTERLILISENDTIKYSDIPFEIRNYKQTEIFNSSSANNLNQQLQEFEIHAITTALELNDYNKSKTARKLGIPFSTLCSKMKKYNLLN
jgi:two-component system, NtrC family, response regulator AtoC